MNDKAGRFLVVETDGSLREHIVTVLSDAGYEVSTDCRRNWWQNDDLKEMLEQGVEPVSSR